jgi:arsenite methyltransferase
MIQRAQARVESEGVADMVELRVADARALPFEDDHFDAVICESVVVFVANKQCAMDEYVRVTKPCGYVGLVEATLLKPTDDTELLSYMAGVAGTQGDMPSREEWAQYLHRAGLQDVTARAYQLDIRQEAKARLQRYSARDMLAALARLPRMWFGDPAAKAFLKETFGGVKYVTKVTFDYLGYGVYVGRK